MEEEASSLLQLPPNSCACKPLPAWFGTSDSQTCNYQVDKMEIPLSQWGAFPKEAAFNCSQAWVR